MALQKTLKKVVYWNHNIIYCVFFALILNPGFSIAAEELKSNQAYMVVDSFGKHYFTEPPNRIVVTDWTLLEQLLDLGMVPVGAPELEQYKAYASSSQLPESISDIGTRQSPSLKKISEIQPDLIILGTDQKTLARPLSRIAKVLYYQNFSPRFKNNGDTVLKRNKQLADIFQKQESSASLISSLKNQINHYKKSLDNYFAANNPTVIVVRVFSDGNIIAYSPHSIVGWVVEQLGLNNVIKSKKTKFGEQAVSLEDIYQAEPDYILCYGACSREMFADKAFKIKLIQLNERWPYGGISTMQVILRDIAEKLTMQ